MGCAVGAADVTITTAGEAANRHDSLLGGILDAATALDADDLEHKQGLTIARLRAASTLVYSYEAPTSDPHDVAMKQANPASWITLDYLRRQAKNPELTDAQVLQLHGGVLAESSSTWIPPAAWQACANFARRIEPGEQVVLAFDGSQRRDSTVLVAATLNGRVSVRGRGRSRRGRASGGCRANRCTPRSRRRWAVHGARVRL